MANEKLKWETPELITFSKKVTRGLCGSGSGDAVAGCVDGTAAAPGCIAGPAAGGALCSAGTGVT